MPIHWLVHGYMTSIGNNETVYRQMPWAGSIAAKTMTSNRKQLTVTRKISMPVLFCYLTNHLIAGKQNSLFPKDLNVLETKLREMLRFERNKWNKVQNTPSLHVIVDLYPGPNCSLQRFYFVTFWWGFLFNKLFDFQIWPRVI